MTFSVTFVIGTLRRLDDNPWYGTTSKKLIRSTVTEIEGRNTERLLPELKRVQVEFHPTYEGRARYDQLINQFVARLNDPRAAAAHP